MIRAFQLLMAAKASLTLNEQLISLSLPALVLVRFGMSASEASWLTSAQWLPALLFSAFIGKRVDRFNARHWLLFGLALSMASVIGLLLVGFRFADTRFLFLVICAATFGLAQVITSINVTSLVPSLYHGPKLAEAFSISAAVQNSSRVMGQAFAGPVLQLFGPIIGLASSVFIIFSATVATFFIRSPTEATGTIPTKKAQEDVSAWRLIFRESDTRNIAISNITLNFGGAVILGVFFAFAFKGLALSPGVIGVMLFSGGVSGTLAASAHSLLGKRMSSQTICAFSGIISGLSVWLIPAASLGASVLVLIAYEIIFSASAVLFSISFNVILERSIESDSFGKLLGVISTMNTASLVAGAFLAGALAHRISVVSIICIGCCGTTVGAACLVHLLHRVNFSNMQQTATSNI